MKKTVKLSFLIFMFLFSANISYADTTTMDTINQIQTKVEPVLNNLKKHNNFQKNYMFVPYIDINKNITVYQDSSIRFNSGALSIAENDDLIAGLLSIVIARSENGDVSRNQWKGFICGFGLITAPLFNPWVRGDLNVADLVSIEYLVRSGYNPVALEVLALRMSGDKNSGWSEFWSSAPNGSTRAKYIHKYIYDKYPQYLEDSESMYYRKLIYMPCFEKSNSCNNVHIESKFLNRANKRIKQNNRL